MLVHKPVNWYWYLLSSKWRYTRIFIDLYIITWVQCSKWLILYPGIWQSLRLVRHIRCYNLLRLVHPLLIVVLDLCVLYQLTVLPCMSSVYLMLAIFLNSYIFAAFVLINVVHQPRIPWALDPGLTQCIGMFKLLSCINLL